MERTQWKEESATHVDLGDPLVDGVEDLGLQLGVALLGQAREGAGVHVVGGALWGGLSGGVLAGDGVDLVDAGQGAGECGLNIAQHLCKQG